MITTDLEKKEFSTTITALNRCIEACTDGEKGYGVASADAREPALKSLLRSYEQQRADFVSELQRTIDSLGASHENQGTLRGSLHRGWTGARLQVEGHKDEVIVDECIRGESGALTAYDRALAKASMMPDHVRKLIEQQRSAISAALEDMRNRLAFGRAQGPASAPRRS